MAIRIIVGQPLFTFCQDFFQLVRLSARIGQCVHNAAVLSFSNSLLRLPVNTNLECPCTLKQIGQRCSTAVQGVAA